MATKKKDTKVIENLKAKQLFYHDEEMSVWVNKLRRASKALLSSKEDAWHQPINILAMKALGIPESAYKCVYYEASLEFVL